MGKTKGLWLGNWKNRNDQPAGIVWGKKIKICGVWFGVGFSPGDFWLSVVEKFEKSLTFFKSRNLSFTGKANIVNIMGLSKLWYVSTCLVVPALYIRKFNKLVFKYFWGRQWEPVSRNTLI
jgi:hypothetical protein